MSEHRRGPWKVENYSGGLSLYVQDAGGDDIARVRGGDPDTDANARLIAAAPDLLAACKSIAAMAVSWQPLSNGDIADVRAAIAKAEGR